MFDLGCVLVVRLLISKDSGFLSCLKIFTPLMALVFQNLFKYIFFFFFDR